MLTHPGPSKGDVSRDRHVASGRNAMDAAMQRIFLVRDDGKAAYGEVVWSWRRDRGVYPCRPILAGQR